MQELEYYSVLLNIVEQDQVYDAVLECDHMRADSKHSSKYIFWV